jgi:hypothetical protein
MTRGESVACGLFRALRARTFAPCGRGLSRLAGADARIDIRASFGALTNLRPWVGRFLEMAPESSMPLG